MVWNGVGVVADLQEWVEDDDRLAALSERALLAQVDQDESLQQFLDGEVLGQNLEDEIDEFAPIVGDAQTVTPAHVVGDHGAQKRRLAAAGLAADHRVSQAYLEILADRFGHGRLANEGGVGRRR